ncbi:MAG: hypothetical protein V7788_11745 [Alphaproteobacteria bacterium]|jgi:hypothetical protein
MRTPLWLWVFVVWLVSSTAVAVLVLLLLFEEWDNAPSSVNTLKQWTALALLATALHVGTLIFFRRIRSRVWSGRQEAFWQFFRWYWVSPILLLLTYPYVIRFVDLGWRAIYIIDWPSPGTMGLYFYIGLAFLGLLPFILMIGVVTSFVCASLLIGKIGFNPEMNSSRTDV